MLKSPRTGRLDDSDIHVESDDPNVQQQQQQQQQNANSQDEKGLKRISSWGSVLSFSRNFQRISTSELQQKGPGNEENGESEAGDPSVKHINDDSAEGEVHSPKQSGIRKLLFKRKKSDRLVQEPTNDNDDAVRASIDDPFKDTRTPPKKAIVA